MKKLLVTGGAGFIGSEFVRQAVSRGFKVCVVDCLTYAGDTARLESVAGDITFYHADICNAEFMQHIFKSESPDIVVHWAAESHVDRSITDASPFIDTNVRGTQVMLDAAKRYGVEKFINISTDEVYGDLDETGQFTESTPLNPSSPYSVSKGAADMLGRAFHRTHGLPVITVRPSNNYGPWQYPEKLIPVVIMRALGGQRIPVYGEGRNVREWLFVADCTGAIFEIIADGLAGEVYNLGSGEEKRNIDVVKSILAVLGKPESLIEFVQDRPGHDYRYSLNAEKIREQLNWETDVKFDAGLEATVKWYTDNLVWTKGKLSA